MRYHLPLLLQQIYTLQKEVFNLKGDLQELRDELLIPTKANRPPSPEGPQQPTPIKPKH